MYRSYPVLQNNIYTRIHFNIYINTIRTYPYFKILNVIYIYSIYLYHIKEHNTVLQPLKQNL